MVDWIFSLGFCTLNQWTAENAPWVMHFAVSRPLGGLRGEGDLSPLLTWLRR